MHYSNIYYFYSFIFYLGMKEKYILDSVIVNLVKGGKILHHVLVIAKFVLLIINFRTLGVGFEPRQ